MPMTIPSLGESTGVPLPSRHVDHSFLPAGSRVAVAPGDGTGQHNGATPWVRTREMACLVRIGTSVCLLATVASSVLLWAGGARAEPVQAGASADVRPVDPFAADIAEASQRFDVPAAWIRAVMRAESSGDVQALSPNGAMGLMQIMPATYAELRARYGLGADPFAPRDNILAGSAYLRELHSRYGSPGFLAAYNAGPARYEDHLATGRPLPAETQHYVEILAPMLDGGPVDGTIFVAADPPAWTSAPLFIARADTGSSAEEQVASVQPDRPTQGRAIVDVSALAPQSDGLFVPRTGKDRRP